ncbi:rhodanese-like domain-containing protein [Aequorivita marina]|uniref:rhodanese-like domain-containing protein n=1 Tax=Aequorivita marina TaxID=3073654 RepID=UPI002874842E|nr:rhodanese-like domain-containing protein [Aequorivita sp. S2608]MDS1298389.1 rhodanese-like domain-containing protein [Aequorivita sp. S2608]
MKRISVLIIFSMLLFFASCKNKEESKEIDQIEVLAPQKFHDATAGNQVQLLDVRTNKEFEEGHLESAVNIDVLEDDFAEKAKTLDKSQPVYLYCRSGNRSQKAAATLKDMGFEKIYDMEGGYLLWSSEGLKTQK